MAISLPDELKMGIPDVDEAHLALYEEINRLHEAMRTHSLGAVFEMADYLDAYAKSHFSAEERAMIEAGYPGLPDHLARHADFKKSLVRWRTRLSAEGATAPLVVELSSWLTSWLRDHIRRSDAAMARFLRARDEQR